jgi:antitoxin component of MazEF toxin-antitoxin module
MNTANVYDGNIARFGNSQGIRIPIGILQQAHLYEDFEIIKGGKIPIKLEVLPEKIIIRPAPKKLTIEELFKDWNGEPPEKLEWWEQMKPMGEEII